MRSEEQDVRRRMREAQCAQAGLRQRVAQRQAEDDALQRDIEEAKIRLQGKY